jgi:hypothetical protein
MPNLLFQALLSDIDNVARAKGLKNYRIQYKRNARGELVIALILEDDPEGPLSRDRLPV